MYKRKNGQISCAKAKDCPSRVQLKVAKRTNIGSCLHEKVATVFLAPGKTIAENLDEAGDHPSPGPSVTTLDSAAPSNGE